jgi:phosphatidylglycerophosphatase A
MFGLGNSRYAPGTVASFVTCLIYITLFNYKVNILILIGSVSLIFLYSIFILDELKNSFSEIDAKEIVIDEFVGQSIPLLSIYNLVLFNNINNFILYTFSVFFLFRLFDIFKPYPINIIDKKIKNGFGVMLDDVLAGIYSVIVFFLIFIVLNYV